MTDTRSPIQARLLAVPLNKITNTVPTKLRQETDAKKTILRSARSAAPIHNRFIPGAHLRAAWRLLVVTVESWLPQTSQRTADDIAFEQLSLNRSNYGNTGHFASSPARKKSN